MTAAAVPSLTKARSRSRYRPNRTLISGLLLLAVLLFLTFFPAAIAPYSPTDFDYKAIL